MNINGQYYLITAVIIASLMVGLISVFNYVGQSQESGIYDLEQELKIESRNVFDYGMAKELDESEFDALLSEFVGDYIDYGKQGRNMYFIYGTPDDLTVKGYQQAAEDVIIGGTSNVSITSSAGAFSKTVDIGEADVTLYTSNAGADFSLTAGRNFYFLITEELNNDKYVIKW